MRLALLRDGILRFVREPWNPDKAGWQLLAEATSTLAPVAGHVEPDGSTLVVPLVTKGRAAGVVVGHRRVGTLSETDRSTLTLVASQVSMAMESNRSYREIDGLLKQYVSTDVAAALLADSEQAALGGAARIVTTLFADLRGFTGYSERATPVQVVELLNHYFGIAVPIVLDHGGTVTAFIGDAIMALFNAPTLQDDHALRAARTALALQQAIGELTAQEPWWPRFRVGINTGEAVVGNIGSSQRRTYTAIGDAVNLASRLEGIAEPGQVVIGADTFGAIRDLADVQPLGTIEVKGKQDRVEAYVLRGLRSATALSGQTVTISVPRLTREST